MKSPPNPRSAHHCVAKRVKKVHSLTGEAKSSKNELETPCLPRVFDTVWVIRIVTEPVVLCVIRPGLYVTVPDVRATDHEPHGMVI